MTDSNAVIPAQSAIQSLTVIPAKAGIQYKEVVFSLDPGLHRGDGFLCRHPGESPYPVFIVIPAKAAIQPLTVIPTKVGIQYKEVVFTLGTGIRRYGGSCLRHSGESRNPVKDVFSLDPGLRRGNGRYDGGDWILPPCRCKGQEFADMT